MDLLSLTQTIWRHKLATLPVILLTLLGSVYVMAIKKPVYEATSSYILINPPAPPSAEAIAQHPELGKIHYDNPYNRFGDVSVVVSILTRTMASEAARHPLIAKGADSRFVVGPTTQFGVASPIVQITGVGPSPRLAIRTADMVSDAVTRALADMQAVQRVDPRYRITALQVEAPDHATLHASGQLRMLVGVLALGGLMLFLVVSVRDAFAERSSRAVRAARSPASGASDSRGSVPVAVPTPPTVASDAPPGPEHPSVAAVNGSTHQWSSRHDERAWSE